MPKKRKSRKSTKKINRKWGKYFVIAFLLLGAYLLYLDRLIVNRFETRRWNLPSRIYSDAFPLYNNKEVSANELQDRLTHLGYHQISDTPAHFGEYRQNGNSFEIFLHSFDYPHENFQGYPISFQIEDNHIMRLEKLKGGENIKLVNLEPELIASIFDEKMEDRTFVSIKDIPETLIKAVILIEDERFYSHFGVDPIGIARAFVTNVLHVRLMQGGSTLTQQMVKNFFLTQDRTLARKINEMFMALLVEMRYSKQDILEVYLNEIYFGQRGNVSVTGVEEASQLYFSKHVGQLTIDECALLAALIRSPGLYSPFNKPESALSRRNLVLDRLTENKVIIKKDYEDAKGRPLPKRQPVTKSSRPTYFVDYVQQQLKDQFSQDILSSEGLRIFTTLDMHLQRAARKSVKTWLNKLETQRDALKKNAAAGKYLEGALIALQPKTGFIRAYVGGRDYTKSQFDILSLAYRQPGSTFKPFVYLAALDPNLNQKPFTLSSFLNDNPLVVKTGAGNWKPQNYDKKFHGDVPLRQALAHSYNVATAWLAQQVGLEKIVDLAQKAGMSDTLKPYASLALGAFEVRPIDMAQAYTIFSNAGVRSQPIAIRRVVTAKGEVLEKKSMNMEEVCSPDAIYLTNKALEGVFDYGTAASARTLGFNKIAAGKTGTTSDYKDSWFVGFTPDLLALSWVGYTDNSATNLSGATGALPIWTDFMKTALDSKSDRDFKPTDKIIIVPIDKNTGLVGKKSCGEMNDEYFIEGTEPKEYCN